MGERIRDQIRLIENLKHQIMDLMEKHPGVFEEYERLVSDYNAAVVAAKHEMRVTPFTGKGYDYGGGFKIQKRVKRGYDVERLRSICPEVLSEPGVVKSVNTKAVKDALKRPEYAGVNSEEAYFETEETPAAYGPTELKIGL